MFPRETSAQALSALFFFLTKQTLVKLDECRAALGQVVDRGKVLQSEPEFGATVGPVGGALELRWQSASRRAEREVQRCSDIQDNQLRWDWLQICMHGISFSPVEDCSVHR